MNISFSLFGSVAVATPSRTLGPSGFPSRKAKQVCELLAVAGGQRMSKDHLIDLLWSDRPPKNPSGAVDHTLSLLRREIGLGRDGRPVIVTDKAGYRIDLGAAEVDVLEFDRLVDESASSTDVALGNLLKALALVRGEVLEDEPYAAWAEAPRERYRRRVERARLDAARLALVVDQPDLALRLADEARAAAPLALEEAFTLSASALSRLGRRQEAIMVMADLERRLRSELGAGMSAESSLVQTMIRRPASQSLPVRIQVRTRAVAPPAELPLLGRADELAVIADARRALEASAVPLGNVILLEGSTGMGKTRLLAEVAAGAPALRLSCMPSDREFPLFVATRLLSALPAGVGTPVPSGGTEPAVAPAAIGPGPWGEVAGGSVPSMYQALAAALSGRPPTTLLVDDLHWIDSASLAVLAALVQPGAGLPLLLVAARNPRLMDGGPDLLRSAHPVVLGLGPIPRAEVERLGAADAWCESGGHPGLLQACLAAGASNGVLGPQVRQDLLTWVDEVGPGGRILLEVLARLGDHFTLIEVARAVGLPLDDAATLLAGPEEAGLIRRVEGCPDRFEIAADVVRRIFR